MIIIIIKHLILTWIIKVNKWVTSMDLIWTRILVPIKMKVVFRMQIIWIKLKAPQVF
jgi:hypothetical protein